MTEKLRERDISGFSAIHRPRALMLCVELLLRLETCDAYRQNAIPHGQKPGDGSNC